MAIEKPVVQSEQGAVESEQLVVKREQEAVESEQLADEREQQAVKSGNSKLFFMKSVTRLSSGVWNIRTDKKDEKCV